MGAGTVKSILWVGDGPDTPSGFGRVTREIVNRLDFRAQGNYECTVLGINYRGDPSTVPYPVYAAAAHGDWAGVQRLIWMCDLVKPDVIIIQNDPWNIPSYTDQLQAIDEYKNVPVIGSIAVDGKNCAGKGLNHLARAVFWTRFGLDEAVKGGLEDPDKGRVIPLGIDAETFHPMDKRQAREALGFGVLADAFIFGNVNRNQPRKRLDLTIRYFAKFLQRNHVDDAWLCLHVAPTGDTGIHLENLARYYGCEGRVALRQPPVWYGLPDQAMNLTYNAFDVQLTTTQGEGFGLTTFEGMACGVPQIVPAWSALEELTKDAAMQVPCSTTAIGPPYVNVIGGVADEERFVNYMEALYKNALIREQFGKRGYDRVHEPRFSWDNIGAQWNGLITEVLEGGWVSSSVA